MRAAALRSPLVPYLMMNRDGSCDPARAQQRRCDLLHNGRPKARKETRRRTFF
jgi:hypothetical protein